MAGLIKPNFRRVYQVWKGNNRFCCRGRLIYGPDVGSLLLSMLLISTPAILFAAQICVKIHDDIRKHSYQGSILDDHSHILGFPVLIATIVIVLLDLLFLLLTSSRDPGIVPRNSRPPPELEEAFDITTPSMEWVGGRTPHMRLPRMKEVIVNGFSVKVKYCDTCLLYRPPRASHCSICNNCVQKFDHHCPWVGQCIGIRNYRFFFMFISTSTLLCLYVFTFSWLNIIEEKKFHHDSLLKSMKNEVISVVLIVYTFITVWFVGGLTVFHTYLISTNQTTYENFRYRYDRKENPYTKGLFGNFIDVFFSKIPHSLNDFRSWAPEETIEIGSFTPNIGMNASSSKEKADRDMDTKVQLGHSISLPTILRNVDYTTVNFDNLDENSRDDEGGMDHVALPTEESEANRRYLGERKDRRLVDVTADEKSNSERTLPASDHNIDMLEA